MEPTSVLHLFIVVWDLCINNWRSAIVLSLFTYGLYWLYYGLFISPTRKIPGPLLNRFSFLPIGAASIRWRISREILDLHEKYGEPNLYDPLI